MANAAAAPMVRRVVLGLFVIATIAFFVVQFTNGVGRISIDAVPPPSRIIVAMAWLVAGQLLIGEALVALAEPRTGASAARVGFHLTQPSKYIPAGVAQAASLSIVLRRAGMSTSAAITVWALHTGAVVIGGVGAGLVIGGVTDWPVMLAAAGVVVVAAFNRPLLVAGFARAGRLVMAVTGTASTEGAASAVDVPSSGRLAGCLAANAAGLVAHGVAFALLIDGSTAAAATAIAAYALAQGIATATPLPGGLGAREALLFTFVASDDDITLTAVVLVRLMLMLVEAGLSAGSVVSWGRLVHADDAHRG